MAHVRHIAAASLLLVGIARGQSAPLPTPARLTQLDRDLHGIGILLRIPGMTAGVFSGDSLFWRIAFGTVDTLGHGTVESETAFPVASITKTMAAALIMQLVDSGKISLDDSVGRFFAAAPHVAGARVRDLLSHTSEGTPGEVYLYSGARYGLLGRVAEAVTGVPLAAMMRDRLITPIGMRHTTVPSNVTSASGVVSTVGDLARFTNAVATAKVVSPQALRRMWSPGRSTTGQTLPYGLGWFVQDYAGERVVWHYGQEDAYASLLIYLPSRRLGLVMLTNSSAASDAFRLLDGNIARSLAANAFLRSVLGERPDFARDAMIDSALAQLYMNDLSGSASTLRRAVALHPEVAVMPDLPTFYLILRLKGDALDSTGNILLPRLLAANPHSPMVLFDAAAFYGRTGRYSSSIAMYERLADLPNVPRHWSVVLGTITLAEKLADSDPTRAKTYATRVVSMNYNFGGAVDRAKALLARLP